MLLLFSIVGVIKSQEADNIWKRAQSVGENGLFFALSFFFFLAERVSGFAAVAASVAVASVAAVHLPARKLFMITEIALIDCVAALGMGSPRIARRSGDLQRGSHRIDGCRG